MIETILPEKALENPLCVGRLSLDRFRNYRRLDLDLYPGFNLVAGPNAQGKTNLLEAVYLLATTRLLRGQRDSEAILEGHTEARVEADLDQGRTSVALHLQAGVRKRGFLNGASVPRPSDLLGRLPCVCVSTADLELVRGDPAERRLFLDLELSAESAGYLRHLSVYRRAVEQRNALLRYARESYVDDGSFLAWEAQIAHHGVALRAMREDYVRELQPLAIAMHAAMGGGETLALTYQARDEAGDEPSLTEGLARSRPSDIARGGTSLGPHRDELRIEVGGREARLFGSQGQQRTAVMAIKLATLRRGAELRGRPPMLLLDDILSDLDPHRRAALVQIVIEHAGQAMLTCTEVEAAGPAILDRARIYRVHAGEITLG